MAFTWQALALTFLLALTGTLLLASLGWALMLADTASPFSIGQANTPPETAILLLVASLLKLSLPGGLAERHFDWESTTVTRLHRESA